MRRTPAAISAALLLSGGLVVLSALPASAAVISGTGQATTPAQPYLANPNASDWLGSYSVGGEAAWPTEFALLPPDQAEPVGPPAAVDTKWGTAIPAADSSLLAYLLWKYGTTTDADTAAALAHVIFSLLSAPQNPGQLSPVNDFIHIAYDGPFHLSKLPTASQTLAASMLATSSDVMGPWTIDLTPPAAATIGTASDWSLSILGGGGVAVPSVPVQVTVTDATLAGGVTTLSLTTPSDGSPLTIPVRPTSANPSLTVDLDYPLAAALAVDPADASVAKLLRRSDSVTALSLTIGSAAGAPASPPSGPVLAMSGSSGAPLTGLGGLFAVLTGLALVLVAERRRITD